MKRLQALDKLRSNLKEKSLAPMEVTVGSDTSEGLKEGLEMAEEVIEKGPKGMKHMRGMKEMMNEELPELEDEMEDEEEFEKEDLDEEADEIVEKMKISPELMEKVISKLSI